MLQKKTCGNARAGALVAAIAAAVILSPASLASPKTTAPAKTVTVLVVIHDQGINVYKFQNVQGGGNVVLTGPVARGEYLSFNVLNRSKAVQVFTMLGKKTRPIKPGGKGHLFAAALNRGNFLYKSTSGKSKTFRGYIAVA
jgi:hypothetical protein